MRYNNEGMSISSMARLTGMSKSNVVNWIRKLGGWVQKPVIMEDKQKYQIDEMSVTVAKKRNYQYVIYAINKNSGRVVDLCVGGRTIENIYKVVNKVLKLNPARVSTDKLGIYTTLIPDKIHRTFPYNINVIERNNLTLRTNLKRLGRKTICYSKTKEMLECSLKIYFWGNPYRPNMVSK